MAYGEPTFKKSRSKWYVHGLGDFDTKPEAIKAAKQLAVERNDNVVISGISGNGTMFITIAPNGRKFI